MHQRQPHQLYALAAIGWGVVGAVLLLFFLSRVAGANGIQQQPEPILVMSKSDSPDPVPRGAPLVYTVTYQNVGQADATHVVITDTLDPSVNFVAASPPPDGGVEQRIPYWNIGTLTSSFSGRIVLTVSVPTGLSPGVILVNTATISCDQTGPISAVQSTQVIAHGDPVTLLLAPSVATRSAGQSISYSTTAEDAYGNAWDVTSSASYTITPGAGGSWLGNTYFTQRAGDWVVTSTYAGLYAIGRLTVTSGAPHRLALTPRSATIAAGQVQTYTAEASDAYGNRWDATANTSYSIAPGAGGSWVLNRYTAEKDGTWVVTGVYAGLTDTVTLTVTNVAPTAHAGGPYAGDEGRAVRFDGSASFDPGNDIILYEWDFDYRPPFAADVAGVTADHVYWDNGVYTAALQVTDDNGATGLAMAAVSIANVAPTVEVGPDVNVDEGVLVRFNGVFSDPGTLDTHQVRWLFGDGGAASGVLTPSHAYAEPGDFTVTLVVTDDDGGAGSDTLVASVQNLPPTARIGGPYAQTAGQPVVLNASASTDPGGGPLSYTWDLDADGQYDDGSGALITRTWTVAGVYTIGVRVEDSRNTWDTASTTVSIGPASLHHIVVSPSAASILAGQVQTYTAEAFDEYGNSRGDVTAQTAFSILEAGHGGWWVGNVYTGRNPGTWTVQGAYGGVTDTALLTVLAPVLRLTKADFPDPVNAGGILYYTILITNSGNQAASNVVITETYDSRVSFVSASPPPQAGSGNRRWVFPTLAAGGSRQIDVVVQVASPLPVGTLLTNVVIATSSQTTSVTATQPTRVQSVPNFQLAVTDAPDPVSAGDQVVYSIVCLNNGTAPATNFVISAVYDSRLTFLSATPSPSTGNNVWRWPTLGVGETKNIVIQARVRSPLPNGTVLTTVVTADSDEVAAIQSHATTQVRSAPVIAFGARAWPEPVAAGALLTYTLRYTNTGNADATGAVVTATLDGHTTFDWASPAPSGSSGRVVHWNMGVVAGSTVSGTVGGTGQIVMRARVTLPLTNGVPLELAAQFRDNEGDALQRTVRTTVTSAPVFAFTKSDGRSTVYAGERLTYTLIVTNSGNENVSSAFVTDTLPSNVQYLGCQPAADGTCERNANSVTFRIPTVPAQSARAVRVIVRVNDPLPVGAYWLTNTAQLAASRLAVPITARDVDLIGTRPDLALRVTYTPSLFSPGGLMTYTVTYSNAGRMDAAGVYLSVTLPLSTTYVGGGWTPAGGRSYTSTVGALPAGANGLTRVLTVRYAEGAQIGVSQVSAPFRIAARDGDQAPGNNTYTCTVGVPDLVITQFRVEPLPVQPNRPLTFVIVIRNQGTGIAWDPSRPAADRGPYVDVFTDTVRSYPFDRDGIWDPQFPWYRAPAIEPGATHIVTRTHPGFTAQELLHVRAFYAKVDNYYFPLYGHVPETDEWNNVAGPISPYRYYIYLPLALKSQR